MKRGTHFQIYERSLYQKTAERLTGKPTQWRNTMEDKINLNASASELHLVFDRASKIFIQLQDELEKLKVKYGTSSQFVKIKQFQLDVLIEMQETAANKINELINALQIATVTQEAQSLIISSLTTGVHTEKLLKLMLPNEE